MPPIREFSTREARTAGVRVRDVVLRVGSRVLVGPVFEHAAQLAFYAVLALAPFLLVLTSLAGFASDNAIERLLGRAESLMPVEAFQLVSQVVDDLVSSRSATLLTVGLLTALWSASRAADAFRNALNSAYELKRDGRSYVRRQFIAIAFTLTGAVLALASMLGSVITAEVIKDITGAIGVNAIEEARVWGLLRWPITIGCLVVVAALAYRTLPDVKARPTAVWSGAVVATVLFLASSRLFALYVERFADFGPTYGALAGGVVLLLWSWLSAASFIVGGEVTAAFPGARPRRD